MLLKYVFLPRCLMFCLGHKSSNKSQFSQMIILIPFMAPAMKFISVYVPIEANLIVCEIDFISGL